MSEPRLIKKYPNRRLYDTEQSRYITLEDIRAMVTERTEIKVTEQRTGRDITRAVLLQVIADMEQTAAARLSGGFLALLIRSYLATPTQVVAAALEQTLHQVVSSAPAPSARPR